MDRLDIEQLVTRQLTDNLKRLNIDTSALSLKSNSRRKSLEGKPQPTPQIEDSE